MAAKTVSAPLRRTFEALAELRELSELTNVRPEKSELTNLIALNNAYACRVQRTRPNYLNFRITEGRINGVLLYFEH